MGGHGQRTPEMMRSSFELCVACPLLTHDKLKIRLAGG